MNKKKIIMSIFALIAMITLYNMIFVKESTVLTDDFIKIAENQNITEVILMENTNGNIYYQFNYRKGLYEYYVESETVDINNTIIKDYTIDNNIKVNSVGIVEGVSFLSLLNILVPLITIMFIIRLLTKQIGSEPASMNRVGKTNVKFDDVIGHEEVKEELQEILVMIANADTFRRANLKMPKGILLEGPSGIGKTLLAKALASEANIPFYTITSSDFDSKFVGEGAKKIKKIFNEAQKTAPSIIFFDEFDSIGTRDNGSHQEEHKKINQFLTEMDGIGTSGAPVIILAATNNADNIDRAIKRSGRLDRTIKMSYPDTADRRKLVEYYLGKYKFIDFLMSLQMKDKKHKEEWLEQIIQKISAMTLGMSHADIDNVISTIVRKIILHTANTNDNDSKFNLTDEFFQDAVDIVLMGPARKSNKYTADDKRLVAYHEIGHALVGHYLKDGSKVNRITIVPRGNAGGYTSFQEDENASKFTDVKELKAQLATLMAGNAAERIFMNKDTLGASNDYEKVMNIATKMVTKHGISKLGLVSTENISDKQKILIEKEIQNIIKEARTTAESILSSHKTEATKAMEYLVAKESITYEEMLAVIK